MNREAMTVFDALFLRQIKYVILKFLHRMERFRTILRAKNLQKCWNYNVSRNGGFLSFFHTFSRVTLEQLHIFTTCLFRLKGRHNSYQNHNNFFETTSCNKTFFSIKETAFNLIFFWKKSWGGLSVEDSGRTKSNFDSLPGNKDYLFPGS